MSVPSSEKWPCTPDKYHRQLLLGRGSISAVWKATVSLQQKPEDSMVVALKIIDLEGLSTELEESLLQEVQTMRLAAHTNLLPCYCSFVTSPTSPQLLLVTEYMDRGSCLKVMEQCRQAGMVDEWGGFSEDCIAYILHCTASGLAYLHSQRLIHRDVKAGNVLLSGDGAVKLTDFGVVSGSTLQQFHRRDAKNAQTFVGTPCYMAPEVMDPQLTGGTYDNKADLWSLGITALELAKGAAPFAHQPPMMVLKLTVDLMRDPLAHPPDIHSGWAAHDKQLHNKGEAFSEAFDDFCRSCLAKTPTSRPSAAQLLLSHPFLRVLDEVDGWVTRGRKALIQLLSDPKVFPSYPDFPGPQDPLPSPLLPPVSSTLTVTPTAARTVQFSEAVDLEGGALMHSFLEPGAGEDDDNIQKTVRAQSANGGKFVPGTTWVFDSGGSSNANNNANSSGAVQDFLEDFESDLTLTSIEELSNSNHSIHPPTIISTDEPVSKTSQNPNLTLAAQNPNLTLTPAQANTTNTIDNTIDSTDAFLDEFELEVVRN